MKTNLTSGERRALNDPISDDNIIVLPVEATGVVNPKDDNQKMRIVLDPVSYTHLDVYKRQLLVRCVLLFVLGIRLCSLFINLGLYPFLTAMYLIVFDLSLIHI